ncbi:MAG: hypothetical protein F6K26_29095 [Moorea sp. SIO2I5]|nr:hypothetical protein [Moorena sp. SIO2I5]
MGRWGDGEMGRWGDGEMGRIFIKGNFRIITFNLEHPNLGQKATLREQP